MLRTHVRTPATSSRNTTETTASPTGNKLRSPAPTTMLSPTPPVALNTHTAEHNHKKQSLAILTPPPPASLVAQRRKHNRCRQSRRHRRRDTRRRRTAPSCSLCRWNCTRRLCTLSTPPLRAQVKNHLLTTVASSLKETAALLSPPVADEVDQSNRSPSECLSALRSTELLVPKLEEACSDPAMWFDTFFLKDTVKNCE